MSKKCPIPESVLRSQQGYAVPKLKKSLIEKAIYAPLPEKQKLTAKGIRKIHAVSTDHHFPDPQDPPYGLWIHRKDAPTFEAKWEQTFEPKFGIRLYITPKP